MTKTVKAAIRPLKQGEDPRVEQMVSIIRKMLCSFREVHPKAS